MKGFHFGDFLNLENNKWRVSGDTIYNGSAPFAIIDDFKSTFYGAESKLILRDIKSGRLGLYTDKGK